MAQQKFHAGDSVIVLWTSYDVTGKVKIELSKNNGAAWATLKDSVDIALGHYTWNIPKPRQRRIRARCASVRLR